MTRWYTITNTETDVVVLKRAKWCASFWCHFKGLMLVGQLGESQGLLFVNRKESRSSTTIHMLFMRFPIGVIWMDSTCRVVDKTLAKPWRLAYAPNQAAQYFIEAAPDILDKVSVGDILRLKADT